MIKTKFPESFYAEEEKAFKVSPQTKKMWAVLLDLLIEFDRVCKKNGIKYMIDGGTQLGAVRHGGFIPWDDDVDVIMLREEYEKLNKIASEEFRQPYFWQTTETDPDHGRPYPHLRNGSTTMIPRNELCNGKSVFRHNQGAYMDVFVCDNVPDDETERRAFLLKLHRIKTDGWLSRMSRVTPWSLGVVFRLPELVRKAKDCVLRTFGIDNSARACVLVDMLAQKYKGQRTKYVSHITFCPHPDARMCLMIPRRIFEEFTEIEFEGYKFPITKYWNEYMTIVYRDWHKYIIGSQTPCGLLFDENKPYTEYLMKK